MKKFNKEEFQELVKINKNENLNIDTINTRDLWEYLEIKTRFNDWIQRKIDNYGFIEGVDYTILLKNEYNSKGRPIKEFHTSIEMGKELAMTENNELGRCIRKYFIEIEKQYKKLENQKYNEHWLDIRFKGKLLRRSLTDEMTAFVEYAKQQGSKNADKYYMLITKLVNEKLFGVSSLNKIGKNLRDYCDFVQLAHITTAESIIITTLVNEIDNDTPYKEIYKIIASKIDDFGLLIPKGKPSNIEFKEYCKCLSKSQIKRIECQTNQKLS